MPKEQSEKKDRLAKLHKMREQGTDPYPAKAKRSHKIKQVLSEFESLKDKELSVAGRLMIKRAHGKLTFADLRDDSGNIQLVFEKDKLGDTKYKELKNIDAADTIQVTGSVFVTQKGEQSILISEFILLSKALLPLPEKWHGIKDEEARYRKRYLDILLNQEVSDMFRKKAIFWQNMRDFLIKQDFLEVETPVLENTPGGADAQPFTTHHNALDIDLYLRISMGELWQKRLMVAGFEKTFEIGRQFRNEGVDAEHLQDYTQMEFYAAYMNYEDTMKIVEDMYKYVIKKTFGKLKFKIKDFEIDFSDKWKKIDYVETVEKKLNINVLEASEEELRAKCKQLKLDVDKKMGRGRIIDTLWKHIRKEVSGPAFLINHPVEVSPLAKRKFDESRLVERYQVIIAGSEIGNGYSELNDPIDQAERFKEQAKLREAGDEEAQMHDMDFVEALEHGMPPTSGFGVSERLFSFLMNKPIRECVLFPLLRPKGGSKAPVKKVSRKDSDVEFNIARADSLKFLMTHVQNKENLLHARESEVIMRALAEKLGKNVELWGATGLLHDLDWEETKEDPKQHAVVSVQYLEAEGYPKQLIQAINAHNYKHNDGQAPSTDLDYALRAAESITGLIYASALVRPDKKLASVKVKSIKKKIKDKSFAAKVDRDLIKECSEIGLELDEFIGIALSAMQEIADEIGL